MYNFIIKGTGQRDVNKYACHSQMPEVCRRSYFLVNLSHDYIPINSIPIWSSQERVIFIRNTSKDKTFQYFWEE